MGALGRTGKDKGKDKDAKHAAGTHKAKNRKTHMSLRHMHGWDWKWQHKAQDGRRTRKRTPKTGHWNMGTKETSHEARRKRAMKHKGMGQTLEKGESNK